MSEELLVNVTPQETRVAVVQNGGLQELHIERSRGRGIVANIYKGKVVRVLPGMQAAFVDVGLERTAFLHADQRPEKSRHADVIGRGDLHLTERVGPVRKTGPIAGEQVLADGIECAQAEGALQRVAGRVARSKFQHRCADDGVDVDMGADVAQHAVKTGEKESTAAVGQ